MFDVFNGLPVHPLVVHAAVVLIPLTLLGVLAMLVSRRWRKALGWWVVGLAALAMVSSFAAKESGEALANRVGEPEVHAELGDVMPLIAGLMFVGVLAFVVLDRLLDKPAAPAESVDVEGTRRGSTLVTVVGLVAAVLCLGATFQAYRVGDSGAQAVWAEEIAATQAGGSADQTATPEEEADADGDGGGATATPAASSTAAPDRASGGYTLAQVQSHDTARNCWVAIDNKVYDVTDWITQHPGGAQAIMNLCGTDGTAAFTAQHSGQAEPAAELASFKIGALA